MPRNGKRLRIAPGIYRNGKAGTYEIRAMVGGRLYFAACPSDSTRRELDAALALLKSDGHTATPPAARGTLTHASRSYLRLVNHLASADDLEDDLNAWNARLGTRPRHRIKATDVLAARADWLADGLSPKTINDRVGTLRNLYHRLDGKRAPTPCDEVEPLPVQKTPIRRVEETLMLRVDAELQRREQTGQLRNSKQRARFRVLVSTGRRHSEIMRAVTGDVNLERRVWVVRDGKGGFSPGLYLNDDMLEAWRLFVKADAWGTFSHASFAELLRSCGWPADIRIYAARHNTWITASERGADLADIAAGAGHRDMRMTRKAYVPILNSRMQQLGERLEGRFSGWPEVPDLGTASKSRAR
jgi:integrase